MNYTKIKIKGGALYYAIFVSFIIFALCGFIITASYLNRSFIQQIEIKKQLQTNATNMVVAKVFGGIDLRGYPECFESSYSVVYDTLTSLETEQWGGYQIVKATIIFKTDTINRIALIGNSYKGDSLISLYLQDKNNYLTFSGTSKVTGNCHLPAMGYQNSLASVNNKIAEPIVNGEIEVSDKRLPQISSVYRDQNYASLLEQFIGLINTVNYGDFASTDTINQPFSNPTLNLINTNSDIRISNCLSGNIKIISSNPVVLSKEAQLNNIIVYAPTIVVEKGFIGSVQLFATDSLRVESDCQLTFPSFVAIIPHPTKKFTRNRYLIIDSLTAISGGIVALSPIKINDDNKVSKLMVNKKSSVTGQIYCEGDLQLKGKVVGSVFASSLFITSEWGEIGNILENTEINSKSIPNTFVFPDLLPSSHKKIVTWLN